MASNTINDDLLWEICRFLPAQSILRFRSVSRSWQALLSGSLFLRSLPATTVAGFFLPIYGSSLPPIYTYFPVSDPSLDRCTRRRRLVGATIAASCNGVLLLHGVYRRDFHLWNPATDAYVTLPEFPKTLHERHRYLAAALVYDPRVSPHYKVVRISHEWPSTLRCHVFSSGDGGKWSESKATFELYGAPATVAEGPPACSGSLVAVRVGGRSDPVIVVVDVEEGKMWGLRLEGMPNYAHFGGCKCCFSYLHAYQGCIYLFLVNGGGFVVLELVKDAEGELKWEVKHSRVGEGCGELPPRVVVDADKFLFFFSSGAAKSTLDVSGELERFAGWWQVGWSKVGLVPYYPCLVDPVGAAKRTSTDIPWIEPLEIS